MATLLSMTQQITGEFGLPQPSAVATATDTQTIQFFNLFNREVRELQQSHPWTALQTLFVLNVTQPITVLGDLAINSPTVANLSSTATFSTNPTTFTITAASGFVPVSARLVSVNVAGNSLVLDSQCTGTQLQDTLTIMQDTYAMPADFDYYLGTTWWDRTNRWALLGPDSPQIDQWHRSGIYVTGPRRHFRQVGQRPNAWRIWPPLSTASTTPQELVFEYMSKNTINVSGGSTTASAFANDSDVPILDSDAIMLGVKWRWAQAKRYQYADLQQEYLDFVDRLKARDGGNRIQSLSPEPGPDYITPSSAPDGFWPGNATITGQ